MSLPAVEGITRRPWERGECGKKADEAARGNGGLRQLLAEDIHSELKVVGRVPC